MPENERSAESFGPSPERIRRVDLILRLGRETNSAGGGRQGDYLSTISRAGSSRGAETDNGPRPPRRAVSGA